MNIFYVAATDRMSWGRGVEEWEAIGHAVIHGGLETKILVMYEVTCPEGSVENDIYVNDTGNIVAPKGSEVKDLGTLDAGDIVKKFFAFANEATSKSFYP